MKQKLQEQINIALKAIEDLESFTFKNSPNDIDIILLRAIERQLGIIAVSLKRISKQCPQCDIPELPMWLKIKTTLLWETKPLKKSFLEKIIYKSLPKLKTFLTDKIQQ